MEQRTLLKIKSLAEETMKKTLIFILLCVSMVLTSCVGPYTSTTSYLKIMEKGHSDNYKEYWIKAYDPNNDTEEDAFKIVVNEAQKNYACNSNSKKDFLLFWVKNIAGT
ncbi:hypothetical protein MKZ20_03430 [Psychrobacillus sp. FSL K6-2684]|uniref:hypothetical protein n=1 Tax=Psychrobacillus sp. FSL K6-2684 TaxID=2921547 RepID=UPI0030F51B49